MSYPYPSGPSGRSVFVQIVSTAKSSPARLKEKSPSLHPISVHLVKRSVSVLLMPGDNHSFDLDTVSCGESGKRVASIHDLPYNFHRAYEALLRVEAWQGLHVYV